MFAPETSLRPVPFGTADLLDPARPPVAVRQLAEGSPALPLDAALLQPRGNDEVDLSARVGRLLSGEPGAWALPYQLKLLDYPHRATEAVFGAFDWELADLRPEGWSAASEILARTAPPRFRGIRGWLDAARAAEVELWRSSAAISRRALTFTLHLPLLDELLPHAGRLSNERWVELFAGRSALAGRWLRDDVLLREGPDGRAIEARLYDALVDRAPVERLASLLDERRVLRLMEGAPEVVERWVARADAERDVAFGSAEPDASPTRRLARSAVLLFALSRTPSSARLATEFVSASGRVRLQQLWAGAPSVADSNRAEVLAELTFPYALEAALSSDPPLGETLEFALLRSCSTPRHFGALARVLAEDEMANDRRFGALTPERVFQVMLYDSRRSLKSFFAEFQRGFQDTGIPTAPQADRVVGVAPERVEVQRAYLELPHRTESTLRAFLDTKSPVVQEELLKVRSIATDPAFRARMKRSNRREHQRLLLRSATWRDVAELCAAHCEDFPDAVVDALEAQTDQTLRGADRAWLDQALRATDPELRRRAAVQLIRIEAA